MTYRRLRSDLLAKLRVTPQRLSQRATEVKKVYGPMSTQQAVSLIAHWEELDLSKYLDGDQLAPIRQLAATAAPAPAPARAKRANGRAAGPVHLTIARDIKLSDPVLPKRVLDEAKLMAERVYPLLYIFENSVRQVILQVMNSAAGPQWWAAAVTKDIAATAAKRMTKEQRNAWHGKRAAHPVYFVDMGHLRQIVTLNWQHFQPLFPDQAWFTSRLDGISMSRNVADHHNPLAKDDIKAVEVYTSQWHRQITDCVTRGILQRPGAVRP